MKTRILALFLVLLFVLAGCTQKPANEAVVPMSSQYEEVTEDLNDNTSSDETPESTPSNNKVTYEANGGQDVYEGLMGGDEEGGNKGFSMVVEKNTIPATLSTKWEATSTSPVKGGATKEAEAMRKKVINSKNTADLYKWSGKTYYISPNGDDKNDGLTPQTAIKTFDADAIYMTPLKPGDALLFERGGVWRLTSAINAREGVTYGSYGKGEKPTLVGSMKNYADPELWVASKKENIWKLTVADSDIGLIVFNHGEMTGWKKYNGVTVLEKNGDYYYNKNDETIYLYFDKGNPGKYFDDIEVGLNASAFSVNRDDVVIDNIRIKYFGNHGINMGGNDNATITNCELGFIGGATQTGTTRFGNAIQQWGTTDKQLVDNNWIYQAYDTGYTWQGKDGSGRSGTGAEVYYNNITVTNNVIDYCALAIEFWHGDNNAEFLGDVKNFILNNNILTMSGYGWSADQRPDKCGYAICVRSRWFPNAKGCQIKNNIFDVTSKYTVYWSFSNGPHGEWDISGNTFYEASSKLERAVWYGGIKEFKDQGSLADAVAAFDSKPAKVTWLTK